MADDLIPLRPAPPSGMGSTPGELQCAVCLYRTPSRNPAVVTIMAGFATCQEHMRIFSRQLSTFTHNYGI